VSGESAIEFTDSPAQENASSLMLAFFMLVSDKDDMKCLIAIIVLTFWGLGQSADQTRKATQVLDRFDAFLKSKEADWRSSGQSSRGSDGDWRTWKHNGSSQVDIYVLAFSTPEETVEALKQRMLLISVGPTRKLEGLGDEAYVYGNIRFGDESIHFRSGHFYIRIWANSSTTLHRFSKYLGEVVRPQ
jgi:hypothetical protein